jgi:hypothetical protein
MPSRRAGARPHDGEFSFLEFYLMAGRGLRRIFMASALVGLDRRQLRSAITGDGVP